MRNSPPTLATHPYTMNPTPFFLSIGTAALFAACTANAPAPQAEAPAFNTGAVKHVLDSMNVHYHDRFRDSTTAYFAARYTADACVMAPNMPRVCGIDGITKFYWNNGDSQTTTLDIKGEEVSGTATEVTEVGSYRVLDDEGTLLDDGKFMAIYRNEGGTWKVHREIWNSDHAMEQSADTTVTN
jgi:ketosteroid isomerase-like protein